MFRKAPKQARIAAVLSDGKPRSSKNIDIREKPAKEDLQKSKKKPRV